MPPAFAFAKQIICLLLGRLLQALYIERHQCLLSTQKYVKSRVGASRRLRAANKFPAIIYGGEAAPVAIELDHDKLWNMQDKAEFYGEVLTLVVDGKEEKLKFRLFSVTRSSRN